jgi:hypothetical protein
MPQGFIHESPQTTLCRLARYPSTTLPLTRPSGSRCGVKIRVQSARCTSSSDTTWSGPWTDFVGKRHAGAGESASRQTRIGLELDQIVGCTHSVDKCMQKPSSGPAWVLFRSLARAGPVLRNSVCGRDHEFMERSTGLRFVRAARR